MKHLTFILLLVLTISAKAQQNLVPNPSFEDTLFCPQYISQIHAANQWLNFGGSPEYFNSCNQTILNVPNAGPGYQNAHSGVGMGGLVTYSLPWMPTGPNIREYIGCELLSPLQINTKYFISFFVNCGNWNLCIATDKVGLKFSTVPFDSAHKAPITNSAVAFSSMIVSDTVNWTKISMSFIADSAYQYLVLGNFFDDSNTDTMNLSNSPQTAYYYYDDICVSADSIFSETWTSLNHIQKEEVSLWPNPAGDFFEFKAMQVIDEINVFDFSGRLVRSEKINSDSGRINLSGLPTGVYLATFRKEGYISSYRFSKY